MICIFHTDYSGLDIIKALKKLDIKHTFSYQILSFKCSTFCKRKGEKLTKAIQTFKRTLFSSKIFKN